ncbi:hypothetical protein AGMMS50276_21750 [Synergistales bacterium]|nr:hypothetical protein AGMMS50276_21750 [Synergistales bacterium]
MIFETDYRLENYILNSGWNDFPQRVRERAVGCAIDLTTALVLGSKGRQFEVGLRTARSVYGCGDVPVLGSRERFSFVGAAAAAAHAANSFDIDDGHNMIRGHPGASFVGGVLSAALARNAKYREYLEALVVSYEVTVRWALAMQDYYNFMHSTGAYGAFGTASGAGRLFQLDRKTLNAALSIADFHAPMTPVMRAVEYPSMNKDGVPFGTVVGALAVIEAMEGYEGKTHLLEMPEYRHLLDSLGSEYEIMNLYFKPYTCCRWAHQPITACLDLMKEHGFIYENVEKITIHTFKAAARLSKIAPSTTDEAQYNIAYPVAAAVVHGDLGYFQVCAESLKDERVLEIMKRLEFVVDSEMEALFPQKRLAWVALRLTDGRTLRSQIYAAPGEASDGIDLEWITKKFIRVTESILSSEKQDELLSILTGPQDVRISAVVEAVNAGLA